MPKCALPEHLKERKHEDWIWPLSKINRGANAYGPRCEPGSKGYKPWPPKLIEGYGVSRWENNGAQSIIEIPSFKHENITSACYGSIVQAYERNSGNPMFGKLMMVKLEWVEVKHTQGVFTPQQYSPSAIQSFSPKGFLKMDPSYYSYWKQLDKKDHWERAIFYRFGNRPDHYDVYYNYGPFFGLKGE